RGPHWPPQPRSPNSCSVFSHTPIGRAAPSVKFTLTRSPAPAPLLARSIGYCTRSCPAIGRPGWFCSAAGEKHERPLKPAAAAEEPATAALLHSGGLSTATTPGRGERQRGGTATIYQLWPCVIVSWNKVGKCRSRAKTKTKTRQDERDGEIERKEKGGERREEEEEEKKRRQSKERNAKGESLG
ncbi:hypothetical protein INR49_008100, partial [Caranx melampygus]